MHLTLQARLQALFNVHFIISQFIPFKILTLTHSLNPNTEPQSSQLQKFSNEYGHPFFQKYPQISIA